MQEQGAPLVSSWTRVLHQQQLRDGPQIPTDSPVAEEEQEEEDSLVPSVAHVRIDEGSDEIHGIGC
jgi:hypothetical protein